jgi:HD superfamily phosphohydrolase
MGSQQRKIINDPVYGFITIDHPLLLEIISHPFYQRLRRIHQMAFAHLVYPGAVHTRLHHSLGAYHLMGNALTALQSKGFEITAGEELGAKIAILLHDMGHGPFSHALENVLLKNMNHENISLLIMEKLNEEFGGQLETALAIFKGDYPKRFLHQLISGQLDVDRMDYLTRDSFFTGVSEGVIGYDRIIKMLTVFNNDLMVEEKAIYSIEKFLVSRRLMYWQVYLHKTVLGAEKMLVRIIERTKELIESGMRPESGSHVLDEFLCGNSGILDPVEFCRLDDYDLVNGIKNWMSHKDKVLACLCDGIINRHLFKVKIQADPFSPHMVEDFRKKIGNKLGISKKDSEYLAFTGEMVSTTYNPYDERIQILFKDGSVKDISEVDNALIHQTLSSPVKKFYICYMA